MRPRTLIAIVLTLSPLLAPALATAAPTTARPEQLRTAKRLAAQGRAAHDAGQYGEAIVAYKEAYGLAPSPKLLFNIAQAYRLAGNCHAAVQMYRRFLAAPSEDDVRELARAHLAGMERCALARVPARRVGAVAGDAALRPPSSVAVTRTPPSSERGVVQRRVGLGLMVTGAVAAGIAGYYAYEASAASATVENAYARGVRWRDISDVAAEGERSADLAKGIALGGGVALASGIALYLVGKRTERASLLGVTPTRGGAEVSWAWQF